MDYLLHRSEMRQLEQSIINQLDMCNETECIGVQKGEHTCFEYPTTQPFTSHARTNSTLCDKQTTYTPLTTTILKNLKVGDFKKIPSTLSDLKELDGLMFHAKRCQANDCQKNATENVLCTCLRHKHEPMYVKTCDAHRKQSWSCAYCMSTGCNDTPTYVRKFCDGAGPIYTCKNHVDKALVHYYNRKCCDYTGNITDHAKFNLDDSVRMRFFGGGPNLMPHNRHMW